MDGSEIFSMYKIGCHVKILGVGFSIGFSACKPSSKVLCYEYTVFDKSCDDDPWSLSL